MSVCCRILFFACFLTVPMALLAQSSNAISLGPCGSYTFGTPLDIERAAVSTLGSNGLGTSHAQTFGAGLELSIPTFFFPDIGLSLIGKYSWTTGQFNSNPYSSSDNASNSESTQEFHLSSRYGTASLALLVAYHLSDRWDVGLGGELDYRVQDSLTDWSEILSPSGVIYANGSTRDTIVAGNSISSNPFRVSVPVFLGYTISLGSGITLANRIFGEVDLNEIFAGYASQSFSAGISFSLLFGKHTSAPIDASIVNTPTPPSQPRPLPQPASLQSQPLPVQSAPQPPSPVHILAAVHLEINGVAAKTASVREVDTLIETFAATTEDVRIPKAESRLVRSYIVPDLSVSRFVESEEAIRGWNIQISQAGRILSDYSSNDSVESNAMSAAIELGGANGPSPIVAKMTVTNSQGAIRSVWDTLSLIADTIQVASCIQRQTYLFLSQTTAGVRHQDSLLVRTLLSSLDTSGVLTISPYASAVNPCPERDSLSSSVLSAIRSSLNRPLLIELLDKSITTEIPPDYKSDGCGIVVRYVRDRQQKL